MKSVARGGVEKMEEVLGAVPHGGVLFPFSRA